MAVNLHTTHYRFGIEELLEATHGWHAAEDANPAQGVIAVDTTFLLRFTVQETGGTAAANVDNVFQYNLNGAGWVDITTTSAVVKAVVSVAFTNGQNCTKRLSGTGTFETSAAGCTEDGSSGGNANDIAASGNSETECGLQIVSADVVNNDSIQFRLRSPDFTITNDVVPTLVVSESTIVEADLSSTGAATVSGVAASVFAGVGAAAGVAASAIVGIALWATLATAAGTTTVTLDGEDAGAPTIVEADLSSAGATTVTGVGAATWLTDATASGSTTVSIVGAYPWATTASSAGVATDSIVGAALWLGDANSAGAASDSIVSASVWAVLAAAAGTSTVTVDGESISGTSPYFFSWIQDEFS